MQFQPKPLSMLTLFCSILIFKFFIITAHEQTYRIPTDSYFKKHLQMLTTRFATL